MPHTQIKKNQLELIDTLRTTKIEKRRTATQLCTRDAAAHAPSEQNSLPPALAEPFTLSYRPYEPSEGHSKNITSYICTVKMY